jgi:ketosteroid isomerase-like protein
MWRTFEHSWRRGTFEQAWKHGSAERVVDGGDRFVSIHRVRAMASHIGIESETPLAYFWTFQHGKVVHPRSYWDPSDALEAAGLSE